ncbi:sialate O-acetylesterase [Mucilaginibacter robiniae]|uniref:Sialate O-acetylesterase n=1 Tax=Mucilaginibacter robiniae TaxID=2728022 RepID=A0A7L5E461_9SPHI|nr:sialate O-acetylesterase [Mucilaginibacter robiniae]QJD96484.1 sialate O-acetylesterase [Mucilaginibacter robiniae]
MKNFVGLALTLLVSLAAQATIRLPHLVGNHMVLQRNKPIHIWGWADAGEKVSVSFNNYNYLATANVKGEWGLQLPKMQAGGPYQMVLQGSNKIVLSDILIGDVWVCSGQSNMEFPLSIAKNADEEIRNANYPNIRLYTVNKTIALKPVDDTQGQWLTCNSETVANFSAIGYFFAREIQQKLHVPIGLIHASWGGTVVETWISTEGLAGEPTFAQSATQVAGLDTLSYNTTHRQQYAAWIANFQQQDTGTQNGQAIWAAPELNTADWKPINLPIIWEWTGIDDLWNMDGTVWFRKKITLTKADLQGNAMLSLGVIQNADVTYVNGIEVGRIPEAWGKYRSYAIPTSVLKEGENVIAVKVENYGGDGGFTDPAKNFYLKTASRKIDIAGEWQFKIGYKLTKSDRPAKEFGPNNAPTLLYNGMINPLTRYGIKGVLWYQGESNWFRGHQYRDLFPRLITDWRQKFKQDDFPFLYVQLANYQRKSATPYGSYWAEVREAQDRTLKLKNTGMVTAIDVGDAGNIHPKNKQAVGHRLVLLAEQQVYNLPVKGQEPRLASYQVKGDYILVNIKNAGDGLKANGEPGAFQIAGADQQFHWAQAKIVSKSTIKVYAKEVSAPVAVRYAWEDNPADANIYNSENLPLFPFRTDAWKGLSDNNTVDK